MGDLGARSAARRPPQTLGEKIIANAAGRTGVRPKEIVSLRVDLAFAHDSSGPRRWQPILDELGTGLWDPTKVAIVTDHFVPAADLESAGILDLTRKFASANHVANFFDMEGICHLVLPERGLVRPGMFIAGGDSHTATAGALGAYAVGFGATDMAAIVATGETWLSVPYTVRVDWEGVFGRAVTAKDVMLFLCRELGLNNADNVIEFGGEAVSAMSVLSRMVLTNMSAELGAETGIIAPDSVTLQFLAERGITLPADALTLWCSDPEAGYRAVHRFDASRLSPQVAGPDSPANSSSLDHFAGIRIDQAYIGACVGAKLEDLHMAASILRGRRVASRTRLLVAPASRATMAAAVHDGTLAAIVDAGAVILPSGCGACAGLGGGVLGDGEVCISSTNRNFKGRMGHTGSKVYLASPYSVAAAAVAGVICDPRDFLQDGSAP